MARGIGGDDGPSLFMAVAVIVLWGSIKDWFGKASDKVENTLGGNLPNPLQAETKADIDKKEKRVASTPVQYSKLPKSPSYYQQVADDFLDEMGSWFSVDKDEILAKCKMLEPDELKAVYKAFGVRDNTLLGVAQSTGTLIDWFNKLYSGEQKAEMRKVWSKTGLWD